MPGPKYAVDTHPKRSEIVKAIIKGEESARSIGRRYGISGIAVSRYLNEQLVHKAAAVQIQKDKTEGNSLADRVETIMVRMQKLYDACDAWLTDPEDPGKYNLDPKAWEVDIVYRQEVEGKTVNRKENLQAILEKLEGRGYQPWEIKHKTADPRKLIVETANAMARQLELVAKIQGAIKEVATTNITVNQYKTEINMVVVKTLAKYPEAREALVKALEKLE